MEFATVAVTGNALVMTAIPKRHADDTWVYL